MCVLCLKYRVVLILLLRVALYISDTLLCSWVAYTALFDDFLSRGLVSLVRSPFPLSHRHVATPTPWPFANLLLFSENVSLNKKLHD